MQEQACFCGPRYAHGRAMASGSRTAPTAMAIPVTCPDHTDLPPVREAETPAPCVCGSARSPHSLGAVALAGAGCMTFVSVR